MTFRVESALISSLDPHTDLGALIHAMTSIPAVVNVIQIALIHGTSRRGIGNYRDLAWTTPLSLITLDSRFVELDLESRYNFLHISSRLTGHSNHDLSSRRLACLKFHPDETHSSVGIVSASIGAFSPFTIVVKLIT